MGHMKMKQTSPWNRAGRREHAEYDKAGTGINAVAPCAITAHPFMYLCIHSCNKYWVLPLLGTILEPEGHGPQSR